MLSNAYFLAKFRFDTAENEPAKNLQNCAKNLPNFIRSFANFANPNMAPGRPGSRGTSWTAGAAPCAGRRAPRRDAGGEVRELDGAAAAGTVAGQGWRTLPGGRRNRISKICKTSKLYYDDHFLRFC